MDNAFKEVFYISNDLPLCAKINEFLILNQFVPNTPINYKIYKIITTFWIRI